MLTPTVSALVIDGMSSFCVSPVRKLLLEERNHDQEIAATERNCLKVLALDRGGSLHRQQLNP